MQLLASRGDDPGFGLGLTRDSWQRRHAALMVVLLGMLVVDLGVALYRRMPVEQVATALPVASLFVLLAAADQVRRPLRVLFASTGLLTTCVALVSFTGGALPVHLVFPLALAAIALYHDRLAWIAAVAYVSVFYLVVSLRYPELAFPAGLPSIEVLRWSVALWLVSVLTACLCAMDWRLSSQAQAEAVAMSDALAVASARQRQASELHDTVAQDLATARYALQADDTGLAVEALGRAQGRVREMVSSLLPAEVLDDPAMVVRVDAAQPGTPGGTA